jgi:hypothetical protein
MAPPVLSEFEKQRLANMARNSAALAALVSPELRQLEGEAPPRAPRRARAPAPPREPPGPPRRSARAEGRPLVNYAMDLDELERRASRPVRDGPPRYTRKRLTLEELEAMTDEERAAVRAARGAAGTRARGARRAGACHPEGLTSRCFGLQFCVAQLQGTGGIDSGRGRRVQVRTQQLAGARGRPRRRGGGGAPRSAGA